MKMYFCEKCNTLMQDNCCTICGKKDLREVQDDDFCYLVTLNADNAHYFEENLKLHNIPSALLGGGGLDLRTRTSGKFKIYVPYRLLDKATEIYNILFGKI